MKRMRWAVVAAVIVASGLLWGIPSNVAELVARSHRAWFGLYSDSRLLWNLLGLLVSLIVLAVVFAPDAKRRRQRLFRSLAGIGAVAVALVVLDLAVRATVPWPYVLGKAAYHRPPNTVLTGTFEDAHPTLPAYPNPRPGYGKLDWTMTTDARGFRNLKAVETADVVALGDSFTEGSVVSDEHTWPARLAERTGLTVYNLGMHGYAPQHSHAALQDHGLGLEPRWVILMLYEGNDFRSARPEARAIPTWAVFVKPEYSPIAASLGDWAFRTIGRLGAPRASRSLDVLSWVPVGVPADDSTAYYAFPPSFLVNHYVTYEDFASGRRWRRTKEILRRIRATCQEAQAELVIAYIPTKARVVLPLVQERLDPAQVRAFTLLQADDDGVKLPPADQFLPELLANFDVKERAVREWCSETGAPFVSLTEPLRSATQRGQQAYYTYDDHWTPEGHELAARVLHGSLEPRLAGTLREGVSSRPTPHRRARNRAQNHSEFSAYNP